MLQDDIFRDYEGNNWFDRNKSALERNAEKEDMVVKVLKELDIKATCVAEVGCSNGWRLEKIRKECYPEAGFFGADISAEAIMDGKKRYPLIELSQSALSEISIGKSFDVVICNFVLHWIDRKSLIDSIAAVDKVVKAGGTLILGDFLPDFNQKRKYHHLPQNKVYTYKQDYAEIFLSLGSYKEILRYTFDHDHSSGKIQYSSSNKRAVCVALRKMKNDEFYLEV